MVLQIHFVSEITSEYLLRYGTHAKTTNDPEEGVNEPKWMAIMSDIGFRYSDNFEYQIVLYLKTGFIDRALINNLFSTYTLSNEQAAASERLNQILVDYEWGTKSTYENDIANLKAFLPDIHLIRLDQLSMVARRFQERAESVCDDLVEEWIASVSPAELLDRLEKSRNLQVGQKYYKKLANYLDTLVVKNTPKLSLYEAVSNIKENPNRAVNEFDTLLKSSVQDYIDQLNDLGPHELGMFLETHFSWHDSPRNEIYADAFNNFMHASESIILAGDNQKFKDILSREFDTRKIKFVPISFKVPSTKS